MSQKLRVALAFEAVQTYERGMKSPFMYGSAALALAYLASGALLLSSARADVKLPAIFSDHAVLQKSDKVPVWGKADPGEAVTVTLDGVKAETKAGADGKWRVVLNLKDKGEGPYELLVEGKNKIAVTDVLVGDVWVCSGQSNMEWVMNNTTDAKTEIDRSANPKLRHFLVQKSTNAVPQDEFQAKDVRNPLSNTWVLADPATTGGMTAVGYWFGKTLNAELKRPIGLVHTSWGGTPSEAWTSFEGCEKDPDLKASKETMVSGLLAYPEKLKAYTDNFPVWAEKYGRLDKDTADAQAYAGKDIDTSSWKKVILPNTFAKVGLPDSGVTWLRKTINVPEAAAKQNLKFSLGTIGDFDAVYWNGVKIGASSFKTLDPKNAFSPREYSVPAAQVTAGESVLAIRVYTPAGNGGVTTPRNGNFRYGAGNTPLNGEWLAKNEVELPPLSDEAKAAYIAPPRRPTGPQNTPGFLYNAMISPLLPYAITGAIWYQGESNAGRAYNYSKVFPIMIEDWRAHWEQGPFPFYFCQLANFMAKTDTPKESGWAELREAQTKTLSLPNTGMAVLIDIGESADIHPRNKKDAGERLGKAALAQTYGVKIPYSGPKYKSQTVEGDKIRLSFEHTDGGLVAKKLPETFSVQSSKNETKPLVLPSTDSELQGFYICGEDKVWKWAQAKVDGESVVVWSSEVPKPIAVRYAWADNPTCNLYNGAGFPAIPFRTDDFPPITLKATYTN
ncbi:MAG TPA: sialate O-acetylesterase [Candidatus Methylacidiphilales bacterium]|nr:sialate O-acetylesterase [Candidatus Methylacidiphilales bacterium]